jgi:hypothetical protein
VFANPWAVNQIRSTNRILQRVTMELFRTGWTALWFPRCLFLRSFDCKKLWQSRRVQERSFVKDPRHNAVINKRLR